MVIWWERNNTIQHVVESYSNNNNLKGLTVYMGKVLDTSS